MTVEDSSLVDGLGISKRDGKGVLTIADHLDWQDESMHFALLEKKIGRYLSFIKSGQFLEVLPNSQGRAIRIELIYQHQPSEEASRFLGAAKKQLDAMGVEFAYSALPENC
ncbi:DUF6572 domain-containing protein [Andreprevotia chitinilytica]|uniref:DUF6572 domain-containing protein n=1 Tax=Andreprevotia chitinilytica TaxID=396808 RepID=UPI00068C7FF4|nr:DUF6572 domain-containing protein [Andreprevotia chitinilytica]